VFDLPLAMTLSVLRQEIRDRQNRKKNWCKKNREKKILQLQLIEGKNKKCIKSNMKRDISLR
jgi:hypothetical protein